MKKTTIREIGAPCSPCNFIESKTTKVLKIKMSCGGGVGGSVWDEYGTTKDDFSKGGFITLKSAFTNEEITINTRFVVKAEEVQLVTMVWDTTPHANYNRSTCKKQTKTCYYCLPKNEKYRVIADYEGDRNKNIRIKEYVETE